MECTWGLKPWKKVEYKYNVLYFITEATPLFTEIKSYFFLYIAILGLLSGVYGAVYAKFQFNLGIDPQHRFDEYDTSIPVYCFRLIQVSLYVAEIARQFYYILGTLDHKRRYTKLSPILTFATVLFFGFVFREFSYAHPQEQKCYETSRARLAMHVYQITNFVCAVLIPLLLVYPLKSNYKHEGGKIVLVPLVAFYMTSLVWKLRTFGIVPQMFAYAFDALVALVSPVILYLVFRGTPYLGSNLQEKEDAEKGRKAQSYIVWLIMANGIVMLMPAYQSMFSMIYKLELGLFSLDKMFLTILSCKILKKILSVITNVGSSSPRAAAAIIYLFQLNDSVWPAIFLLDDQALSQAWLMKFFILSFVEFASTTSFLEWIPFKRRITQSEELTQEQFEIEVVLWKGVKAASYHKLFGRLAVSCMLLTFTTTVLALHKLGYIWSPTSDMVLPENSSLGVDQDSSIVVNVVAHLLFIAQDLINFVLTTYVWSYRSIFLSQQFYDKLDESSVFKQKINSSNAPEKEICNILGIGCSNWYPERYYSGKVRASKSDRNKLSFVDQYRNLKPCFDTYFEDLKIYFKSDFSYYALSTIGVLVQSINLVVQLKKSSNSC